VSPFSIDGVNLLSAYLVSIVMKHGLLNTSKALRIGLLLLVLVSIFFAAMTFLSFFDRSRATADSSRFAKETYATVFQAFGEPAVYSMEDDKDKEVYRFTRLDTWGNPVCTTVLEDNRKMLIRFVRLNGSGGYEFGKVVERNLGGNLGGDRLV